MPPGIRGQFAALGLLRTHQTGCQVWNALYLLIIKNVLGRVFGIPKNSIVFGRPFFMGTGAIGSNIFIISLSRINFHIGKLDELSVI